jgi:glycosyltransferase involved in cell wall biosynthesis
MYKYSIIIPSFNEAHVIGSCIASLKEAIEKRTDVEIIVVDNSSTDGTLALLKSMGIKPVVLSDATISRSRNYGAEVAQGEYLLFLDADMQVSANWLDVIEEYMKDGQTDVLGFVDIAVGDAPWYAKIWAYRIKARRNKVKLVDNLPGRNICVSKALFKQVNGFNEKLKTSEDKDFVLRMHQQGARIVSDPSIELYHLGFERTFKEWMRKEYWRQSSHVDIIKQQGLSLRLLRFPLVSVLHGLFALSFFIAVSFGMLKWALVSLSLWWLPSLIWTLIRPFSRSKFKYIVQFTVLYWIRFHIAGFAVIKSLLR